MENSNFNLSIEAKCFYKTIELGVTLVWAFSLTYKVFINQGALLNTDIFVETWYIVGGACGGVVLLAVIIVILCIVKR